MCILIPFKCAKNREIFFALFIELTSYLLSGMGTGSFKAGKTIIHSCAGCVDVLLDLLYCCDHCFQPLTCGTCLSLVAEEGLIVSAY